MLKLSGYVRADGMLQVLRPELTLVEGVDKVVEDVNDFTGSSWVRVKNQGARPTYYVKAFGLLYDFH